MLLAYQVGILPVRKLGGETDEGTTFSPQVIAYFDSTNRCLYAGEMLGKFDIMIEVHVESAQQLRGIIDGFREKFVGKYADYDVSTITHEYVVIWSPISEF